jgi:hypothetical protein
VLNEVDDTCRLVGHSEVGKTFIPILCANCVQDLRR